MPAVGFPAICKPAAEDASLGITSKSVVRDIKELFGMMDSLQREFQSPVLVEEFVEGRGKSATRKKFRLAFRTLSVPQMVQRLEKAGLRVSALLGDYQGGPWDIRAEVWIILARRG